MVTPGKALTRLKDYVYRTRAASSLLARQQIEQLRRERRSDPKRIGGFGFSAYSQNDEDGILQEMFRRIGVTGRTFIEFGCGGGCENNTTYLLLSGWSGVWLEGDPVEIESAKQMHRARIQAGQLSIEEQILTAENIDALLARLSRSKEVDLLSIDIDGNDYWVWRAIKTVSARVVVIEYNATFRPPISVVQEYTPKGVWDRSSYFGASLSALEALGSSKDYSLIGCNLAGLNAFFVRNDCLGDHFRAPFTAENHYEEPNYDMFPLCTGRTHPRGVGKYVINPPTSDRTELVAASLHSDS